MGKKIMLYLALIMSNQLLAQKDSSSSHVLDEIIVTANKQEQKQSTTGKVISVIGKNQLEKSAGKTIAQVLNETVGVTINGAYNNTGTNQTVYMRGAASGRTLILLDGIPVNDPSTINNEFDLNFISLNDVERIEVCKGAQSTIYGSDAIAGVINIITQKQNIAKPINIKAAIVAGSFNTLKHNLQLYGKSNHLTYTLRNSMIKTSGFSSAYDSLKSNKFDKDGYTGNTMSANLLYQINQSLSVKAFGTKTHYQSDVDDGIFRDDQHQIIKNKLIQTGGGFQYKSTKINITGNYQFSETKRNYERDSLDQLVSSYYLRDQYFATTHFLELYTNIRLSPLLNLLQGIDFRKINMNNHYFSVSGYGDYSSTFSDTVTTLTSVYASLMLNTNKSFATDLGVRFNKHSKFGNHFTFSFNPSFKLTDNTRIFGSIATGFKAPSLYQLFDQYSGTINLKPERSTTIELGISNKTTVLYNRLVGFYRTIQDGIDYDYIGSKYFNFFKQRVLGIEYENNIRLSNHIDFQTNITFLAIKDSTQSRYSFVDTAYHYGLKRPNININASIDYHTKKWYASVGIKYVGKRYDIGGYQSVDMLIPEYFIMNSYASYLLNEKVKFFVDIQNLTNKQFFDLRGFNSIPIATNAGINFHF
jgi:vitamin B12 transporter